MRIFSKKNVRVEFVHPENQDETDTSNSVDPETVKAAEEAAKRVIRYAAVAVVATVGALKVIDTASTIAIKKTKSADSE